MELKVLDDFWDFSELEVGTVVYDKVRNGFRLLIMRGPQSWCSYIGVNQDSPLAGIGYSDVELQDFECHGGLTYAGWDILSSQIPRMLTDRYYLGWDYGHGGDWTKSNYFQTFNDLSSRAKKWTFGEVKAEIEEAFIQMQQVEWELITLRELKRVQDLEILKSKKASQLVRTFHNKRLIRVNGAELT